MTCFASSAFFFTMAFCLGSALARVFLEAGLFMAVSKSLFGLSFIVLKAFAWVPSFPPAGAAQSEGAGRGKTAGTAGKALGVRSPLGRPHLRARSCWKEASPSYHCSRFSGSRHPKLWPVSPSCQRDGWSPYCL